MTPAIGETKAPGGELINSSSQGQSESRSQFPDFQSGLSVVPNNLANEDFMFT